MAGVENALVPFRRGMNQHFCPNVSQAFGLGAPPSQPSRRGESHFGGFQRCPLWAWHESQRGLPRPDRRAFAGLSDIAASQYECRRATSFTSTNDPSAIFTVTESALTFSTVPTTCFLSPCARVAPASSASERNNSKRAKPHHDDLQSAGPGDAGINIIPQDSASRTIAVFCGCGRL